ncbi:Dynactin subunit 1 [Phytophthora ramorum]|uniref:Dynactin subunit 1 n=1 Tax=Phytophthora ramorum TaxID=164328 RepID=UPI0030A6BFF1|nr:Dynactin subunit 1 [Phytophthora ramorum]
MASSIPRPRASLTAAQGLSPVMKVPIGSRVVLSRRRNGTVRYVGKLVTESGEWYGVALDEPKGDNDGMRGKDRYFYCPANHGTFVRRKEIYCVKESAHVLKGPPSPVTDESSSCSSNVSTDQQGDAYGAASMVHPAPTNIDGSSSPLMKTFKGFRKQLDFISLRTMGPGRSREASPVASPTSSSPSSPTARSGLKPPSPFRRFGSFSQGLPTPESPGSPTSKTFAASTDDRRRQSTIPSSPKPSPVRRTNSFKTLFPDNSDGSVRPVESTSPNRFSTFQYPPAKHFSMAEDYTDAATIVENEEPTLISKLLSPPSPTLANAINEVQPAADSGTTSPIRSPSAHAANHEHTMKEENGAQVFSDRDDFLAPSVKDSAPVEIAIAAPSINQALVTPEHTDVVATVSIPSESQTSGGPSAENAFRLASPGRTRAFHVPPIDMSAIAGTTEFIPASSPRESTTPRLQYSGRNSPKDVDVKRGVSPTISSERTRSFRLTGRPSSFRVPGTNIDGSPPSSSENSPSRRSNSFGVLSFDHMDAADDGSEDGQGSPTGSVVPSPRDDVSEASAASAPEPRGVGTTLHKTPRSRQELTAVESISPDKKLVEAGSGERPLFFRRMNVGRSPIERRSSYSSFSASPSSPPKSPTSNSTANAATRSSRIAELEMEISAMRSSHENIVAVLRATNKQHAANVLELRAQVAALTEGNLWLERQLTAKGELVRELREMEKQQQRDNVSVSEVEKILEIKDAQIQTLEREMAQLRQRLARLESDKDSQLYQQFQHFDARRDRDEKRINELRKEVLAMCNERLELQSEVRDLKEMSLRFF